MAHYAAPLWSDRNPIWLCVPSQNGLLLEPPQRHNDITTVVAMVLEVTVSMLEELGCDVLQARSGNDALEKIAGDPSIEILITDINMPGLSGTELAQRVRSFRDQLHVILLSGRESGSYGYPLIRKPILRCDLQRVVAETSGPAKGR